VSILFYNLGARHGSSSSSTSPNGSNDEDSTLLLPSRLRTSGDNNNIKNNNNNNHHFDNDDIIFGDDDKNMKIIDKSIPECARDVFVTLHKEAGGANEHSCRGLLIQDDIIVTGKECSTFDFTFDFAGFGVVEAKPHEALNKKLKGTMKKMDYSSKLGFLEANPPYHYQYVDETVRRARVFVGSGGKSSFDKDDHNQPIVLACGKHDQPIAHHFPLKSADELNEFEYIPLHKLSSILPSTILWEETDLPTAPMLSYKSHKWWVRPTTLRQTERHMKQLLDRYTGPIGSVSIPAAHDEFVGKASALCEVVDPRGHRQFACFKNYYRRYRDEVPFSGVHFFDWLDFGHGKHLLEANEKHHFLKHMKKDDSCFKHHFNTHTVHYFDDSMREKHEIYMEMSEDGKELIARYRSDDRVVPSSYDEEEDYDDPHLYMWDMNEKFYVVESNDSWDKERYGTVKHTGVVAGMPALSGGKAYFGKYGSVWGINYSSGHYRPGISSASLMYDWMKNKRGFNVSALWWVGRKSWSTKDCRKVNWKIEIEGFDAGGLNRSCYEVTVGPTWITKDDV